MWPHNFPVPVLKGITKLIFCNNIKYLCAADENNSLKYH